MCHPRHFAVVAAWIAALAWAASPAFARVAASWPAGGFAIAPGESLQTLPSIAGDGAGGAYVVWANTALYPSDARPIVNAQRVSAGAAAPAWPGAGLRLPLRSSESGQVAIPDGAGGVFTATGGWDWYGAVLIDHLGPDGQAVAPWPADGVRIWLTGGYETSRLLPSATDPARIAGAGPGDIMPSIALDGEGGPLLSWTHVGRSTDLVHVIDLSSSGTVAPGWPSNGVILQYSYHSQLASSVSSDHAGGAFVVWHDGIGAILAAHVLAGGSVDARWPSGGLVVSDAAYAADAPGMVADGGGGCFIAWQQKDAAGVEHTTLQHLRANGAVSPGWSAGRTVAPTASEAGAFRMYGTSPFTYSSLVADGRGGAIVAWSALDGGIGQAYAQRVLGDGSVAPGWPAGGFALGPTPDDQRLPTLAPDGTGGAFAAWQNGSGASTAIRVQRVLGSGTIPSDWPRAGTVLADGAGTRGHPVVAEDGMGGAVVAWEDGRTGTPNIFAGHVGQASSTGIPPSTAQPRLALRGLRPNPSFGGPLEVEVELAGSSPAILEISDLAGRLVLSSAVGSLGPGSHVVRIGSARALPAGIYWLRLRQGGRAVTARGAVIH